MKFLIRTELRLKGDATSQFCWPQSRERQWCTRPGHTRCSLPVCKAVNWLEHSAFSLICFTAVINTVYYSIKKNSHFNSITIGDVQTYAASMTVFVTGSVHSQYLCIFKRKLSNTQRAYCTFIVISVGNVPLMTKRIQMIIVFGKLGHISPPDLLEFTFNIFWKPFCINHKIRTFFCGN